MEIFIPPDDFITDDGLIKKDKWDEFVNLLKKEGLNPKNYENMKENK